MTLTYEVVESDVETLLLELTDMVDLIYMDPPFNTGRDRVHYRDYRSDYNEWMHDVAAGVRDALTPTGNFFLHLDYRSVWEAKLACDDVFGKNRFENDIIWSYNSGGASQRSMPHKHDTILWYSMSPERTYNPQYVPYATPDLLEDEEGPYKMFNGKKVRFNPKGKMMPDVWTDVGILSTTAKERTGYSTQKPVKLLERIIAIGSDPGDIVCDPMCGSGTTAEAAKNMERSFIGGDINPEAVNIARERVL